MKFSYKKVAPEVIRPIIPIELSHKNVTVPYAVLVDSGADLCIFDAEIAEILGISLTSGTKKEFSGVTGRKAIMHIHSVEAKIGGWPHRIEAGFSKEMGPYGYGIVGQKGFFDKFVIKFDYQKEIIELKVK